MERRRPEGAIFHEFGQKTRLECLGSWATGDYWRFDNGITRLSLRI
jgi:hypothetical protein